MFYKLCFFMCFVLSCSGDPLVDKCGLVEGADSVVRGVSPYVPGNKFPWHVAIYEDRGNKKRGNIVLICGGSIVRSNVVITAANCFSRSYIVPPVIVSAYRIVAGTEDPTYDSQDPNRQEAEILQVHIGVTYGGGDRSWQSDIAIVFLKNNFNLSRAVRAVCLELVDEDFNRWQTAPGIYGKVNGWGSRAAAQGLRISTIPVVSDSECHEEMSPNYIMYLTSDKICAGLKDEPTVCPGDGGGGLVFPRVNKTGSPPSWYLRGVLSNAPRSTNLSNPCSPSHLALYTNVFSHSYWITNLLATAQPTTEASTVIPEPTIAQRTTARQNRHHQITGQPRRSDRKHSSSPCYTCGQRRDDTIFLSPLFPSPYRGMP